MLKSWQMKLQSIAPSVGLAVSAGLLLMVLPRLGSWVSQGMRPQTVPEHPQFETAYQTVLSLGQVVSGYTSALGGINDYGIRQLDYDQWRQLNGKPLKDLSQIQADEVKALYWSYWQSGQCERFQPPMDLTCLDSVASFGMPQSQALFANLPDDPQQAALETTHRRAGTRRHLVRPPLTPSKQITLQAGLKRDQALTDWITGAYLPPAEVAQSPVLDQDPAPPTAPQAQPPSVDQIYAQVKPSTVEIWNTSEPGIATAASGMILTADGLVLTNHHVIKSNFTPTVKLADGRKFNATVTSVDPSLDLALLQLEEANNLPVTPFSLDSTQVQVGDTVYAIGSPRGKSWMMSTAQVIELNSTCANGVSPLRCIRTPHHFLYPGNSGGPLINESGEVIGINRAVQQSTGEGVSIPVETIQGFLSQRVGQLPQRQAARPGI